MAGIPGNPGTFTSTGGAVPFNASPKSIIALIAAFAFMLILVQYFPKIIIGLFLLILLSVILARSNTITNLLSGV